jgi:ubiquinone/menaquinone biosynthesis C-methylase UbiE
VSENRVNYDDIASTYDGRYRRGVGEGQHTIPAALRQLLTPDVPNRILEVGCGTGFWLGSFTDRDKVYGLDVSQPMLMKAKSRHAALIRGTAEHLPFFAASFDLVYGVNALHHFPQKESFIREAARTLRPNGMLAIIGMDPHGQHDRWYIYDYFEGTYELDLRRFPPVPQITAWMNDAGFIGMRHSVVERILDHQDGRAVLAHSVLQKTGTSQLILISDEAYDRGLRKIHADLDAADARKETLSFVEDISLVMVTARRG